MARLRRGASIYANEPILSIPGCHRVAGGGPLPTGGKKRGRAVSTGWISPAGFSSEIS